MRIRRLSGLALTGLGLIWLGQGVGLIPGSFMTGSGFWAIAGAIAMIVGIVVMLINRPKK